MKKDYSVTVVRHRTRILVVLTLVFVVNYVDRQILGLLLPLIQKDFELSDTALGLLSGTVFAVFYGLVGLPLAVLADRINRRNIIAASLAVFSTMTVLSGFATQFWHLLLTRLGTGIGEAGTGPAANAIISDLYPPEKRASAMAFYFSGLNVGLLLAYFGGGWIAQHYGWRAAFFAAGIPGLALVAIVLLTVREPPRSTPSTPSEAAGRANLLDTTRHLMRLPAFKWIALAGAMQSFGGYAYVYFLPTFLFNTHHLSTAEIGVAMALMSGIFGAAGTYVTGRLADRYGASDVRWQLYLPAIALAFSAPFSVVLLLTSNLGLLFAAGTVTWLTSAAYLGPSTALVQRMTPSHMRAQSMALLFFIYNMIALGLGPLTVGFVSDLLKPALGPQSLRYALLIGTFTTLLASLFLLQASRQLRRSLRMAEAIAPACG